LKKLIVAATLLFSLPTFALAQDSGLAFLRIGVDAAAGGLADAQVAISHGLFATYWNPAGLAAGTGNSAGVAHQTWVGDVRTYSVGARFAAGRNGGIGILLRATGAGEFEARERPGAPDGLFDAQFVSAGAAYGHTFGPLRVGAGAKFISERIYIDDATGFAFDAGAQMDLADGAISFGASLQNLGRMTELAATATTLPTLVRAGAAISPFRVLADGDGSRLLEAVLVAEVSHVFPTEESRVHLGIAANVLETVVIRGGFITNDALRRFTLGAGVSQGPLLLDYAFLPFRGDFGGPGHMLTVVYGW
jgi:hypothetical protein